MSPDEGLTKGRGVSEPDHHSRAAGRGLVGVARAFLPGIPACATLPLRRFPAPGTLSHSCNRCADHRSGQLVAVRNLAIRDVPADQVAEHPAENTRAADRT